MKSISIPCFPTSQSKGLLRGSKFTNNDNPTCSSDNSLADMGLNLGSFKAAIKAYLVKFNSNGPALKVPIQPLRLFSCPFFHVTNKG